MSFNGLELKSNSNFIKRLLQNSNYHFNSTKENNDIFGNFINLFYNIKLSKPLTIVEKKFYKNNDVIEFGYFQNEVITTPSVYIYTSHYQEAYTDGYTITEASYLLQQKLNELGVNTIIEERSVAEYIKNNSLNYNDAYTATRQFLKDTLEKHPDLDLIIDLHRDYVPYETTTSTIDEEKYAKVMLVQNENYPNFDFAKNFNTILEKYNITRGVYRKKVTSFNQDLNDKVVLIELGGVYNSKEEVNRTIDVLAKSIKELVQ